MGRKVRAIFDLAHGKPKRAPSEFELLVQDVKSLGTSDLSGKKVEQFNHLSTQGDAEKLGDPLILKMNLNISLLQ